MNIFDIVFLAIVVLVIVLSAKKGFVSSCLDTLSVAISALASYILCVPVSDKLYDFFIRDLVKTEFRQALDEMSSSISVKEKVEGMIDALPETAVKFAESVGININSVSQTIFINGMNNDDFLIEELANTFGYKVMISLVQVIVFVILFILVSLLVRAVSNFFSYTLEKLPIVGKVNTLLGGVFGLVKGLIIIFAASIILYIAVETAETGSALQQLEGSQIYTFLKETNPIIQSFGGGAN